MKEKYFKNYILIAVAICVLISLFVFRVHVKNAVMPFFKPTLPAPKSAVEFMGPPKKITQERKNDQNSIVTVGAKSQESSLASPLPDAINLSVPFGSQAPFADWGMPYQEACEEASAIMVHYYYADKKLDPKTMDEEILKMVDWENKTFGYYKDTNAAEIVRILKEYFGYKNVEVSYKFTIEDIKREVADGHPVILPAAGRLLGNPNFKAPGPIYHALVVKGYLRDGRIITNDPGTRNGKDYIYDPRVLMNALHEWNEEDILKGSPAMIVVRD